MELDDLKPAWQRLERELSEQKRMTSALLAERASARVESALRPLFNWQVLQILIGFVLASLGARFWLPRMDQALLMVSGIIVHAYGIALIINGIHVVLRLREIDYSAPVTTLQRRVARLERSYVLSGWILGLPWWLLWIPVGLVVITLAGIDLSRVPPESWLPANIVFGLVGMALTVVGYRWARRSSRPRVRERLARMVSGASIDRAKRLLADVERFEGDAE